MNAALCTFFVHNAVVADMQRLVIKQPHALHLAPATGDIEAMFTLLLYLTRTGVLTSSGDREPRTLFPGSNKGI